MRGDTARRHRRRPLARPCPGDAGRAPSSRRRLASSHCHGERGEGLAGATAILGPGALPEYPRDNSGPGSAVPTDPQQLQIQTQTRPAGAPWRDPFRTAQSLYDFTSTHMPPNKANELKSDDDWAIITFMETVQGAQVPGGGINASNAGLIPIGRP